MGILLLVESNIETLRKNIEKDYGYILSKNSHDNYMAFVNRPDIDWDVIEDPSTPGALLLPKTTPFWDIVAARNIVEEGSLDGAAVQTAYDLHKRGNSIATILFGSRARGDYSFNSGLDLAVITKQKWSYALADEIEQNANELAYLHYGMSMHVQVFVKALHEYLEERRHINTLVTQALLHGIIFSENPNYFISPYAQDKSRPTYDWHAYDRLVNQYRSALQKMTNLHSQHVGSSNGDSRLAFESSRVIQYAIKILVTSDGGYVRGDEDISSLMSMAATHLPNEDLTTEIPLADYQDLDCLQFMPTHELVDNTMADGAKLRKMATQQRRRLSRLSR